MKIQNYLWLALLFLLPILASGQTQLFKDLDFNSGEFTMVGIRQENGKNSVAEALGDFYTDDVAVLNAIKTAWVFKRSSPMYACGYHYHLIILKSGKEVQAHSINLDCHELTTEHGSLYFDPNLLASFKGRLKKLYTNQNEFGQLVEARASWVNFHADSNFVYAPPPPWLEFEGSFGFVYKCPDPAGKCFEQRGKYIQQVKSAITRAYPLERLNIDQTGSGGDDLFFEVRSSFDVYNSFTLYKLDKDSYFGGKWKPYSLSLYSYWRVSH